MTYYDVAEYTTGRRTRGLRPQRPITSRNLSGVTTEMYRAYGNIGDDAILLIAVVTETELITLFDFLENAHSALEDVSGSQIRRKPCLP